MPRIVRFTEQKMMFVLLMTEILLGVPGESFTEGYDGVKTMMIRKTNDTVIPTAIAFCH